MDEKEIEQLLDKFDKSSLKSFELTQDDFKLNLSKRDQDDRVITTSLQESAPLKQSDSPRASDSKATPTNANETAEDQANVSEITAPLVGVVYFAPSPDKPVFKKQGDHVEKGEVVCVIEAMKMINEVKSDVTGTISNILVKDGSMVEYGQPIFQVTEG